jgi:hypothetical protein
MFPLRGLWNRKPEEGDRYAAAEIDWGSYPPGQGVQFQLSGNSPVALSQIVALTVDNARCGSDVQFVFADSGFILQVPAHASGVYPVFTNGLMFYAVALNAGGSDVTNLNIHNSLPPPIPVQLSSLQSTAAVTGVPIKTNATTPLIAASITGTLTGLMISTDVFQGAAAGAVDLQLIDGLGHVLWWTQIVAGANQAPTQTFPMGSLNVRFFNGLSLKVVNSTITDGAVTANVYYTIP